MILTLNDTPTEIIERKTLNYKKANWDKFSNYLNNNIIIDSKLHTPTHIDETVNKLTDTINRAIEVSRPSNNFQHTTPTLTDDIKKLIKARNRARRLYQTKQLE